jgi:hypothetical protein
MESNLADKPLAAIGPRGGESACLKCGKRIADGQPRTVELSWPLMDKKGNWAGHMVRTTTCVDCERPIG